MVSRDTFCIFIDAVVMPCVAIMYRYVNSMILVFSVFSIASMHNRLRSHGLWKQSTETTHTKIMKWSLKEIPFLEATPCHHVFDRRYNIQLVKFDEFLCQLITKFSTAETVEAIVGQLMEKQRAARAAALARQLECGCPDSTCADSRTCAHPLRRISAATSEHHVSSTTGSLRPQPRVYSRLHHETPPTPAPTAVSARPI